jgi:hypothetical protein
MSRLKVSWVRKLFEKTCYVNQMENEEKGM